MITKRFAQSIPLLAAALLAAASPAVAATFCVGTSGQLQNALTTAASNVENDTIQIRVGTYQAPAGGFVFASTELQSLTIRGGYVSIRGGGCSATNQNPAATVLVGDAQDPVLSLFHSMSFSNTTPLLFRVERLLLTGGSRGLSFLNYSSTQRVRLEVQRTIFANNAGSGAVLHVHGPVRFVNNMAYGNQGGDLIAGGVYVRARSASSADGVEIIHNTITANGSPLDDAAGLQVDTSMLTDIYNNILWGNDGIDLRLVNSTSVVYLQFNDLGSLAGTADFPASNWNVDPEFVDPAQDDYHLSTTSPVRDTGKLNPPGGLPAIDFENDPRPTGFVLPDLGADELDA